MRVERLEDRCLLSLSPLGESEVSPIKIDPLEYATDRILVGLRDGQQADVLTSRIPGAQISSLSKSDPNLLSVKLPEGVSVSQAIDAFHNQDHVAFTEPDYIVRKAAVPNDPQFSQLWGMHNTGQLGGRVDADIDAPEVWNLTTGSSSIVVAVIDTGIDYTHPDLAANIWVNSDEVPGNFIDDDSNGYVDDRVGYDFFSNDGDPFDIDSHGTHVAGTIGAVGNNGIGVAGVAHNVKMMALRFLGPNGGFISDAVRALDYAVANGAVLSNNSWGGGGFSQTLNIALENARAANHIFVAAAGNNASNNDSLPHYPSSYETDNIVSVAALTRTDTLASFSNYGAMSVDLGAPGQDIYSTFPGNSYGLLSGTSMATPHVTGALSLLLGQNPGMGYTNIIGRLYESSIFVSALAGKSANPTRLNADRLVRGLDGRGPRVSDMEVLNVDMANFQEIRVTFHEPIDPASFTTIDATLSGPSGAIPISSVTPLAGSSNKVFRILTSTTQNQIGNFTINVGPNITDLSANRMNQDKDGTNGEATADRFTRTFRSAIVQSLAATDLPLAIVDLGTITSQIQVASGVIIRDVNVQLDITHSYDSDLDIALVGPGGQTVNLSDDNGGSGVNYTHTIFDDEAATSITTAGAPFAGAYRPEQPLSVFDGTNSQGIWQLRVTDDFSADVGSLLSFKLYFETAIGTIVEQFLVSTGTDGSIVNSDGTTLPVDDSDIVRVNMDAAGHVFHEIVFDGSDVGLATAAEDIDAYAVLPDGSFLISTLGAVSVTGVVGNGEDILRFIPSILGRATSGMWEIYVDGSDLGLSGAAENIDAIALHLGMILMSTGGNFIVPGASGSDRDIVGFVASSLGNTTVGTFSPFINGSSLSLTTATEDLDALYVDEPTPSQIRLRLSTTGTFSVPNLTGTGTDLATAVIANPGGTVTYEPQLTIRGTSAGLKTLGIDAIDDSTILLPLTTLGPTGGNDDASPLNESPTGRLDDYFALLGSATTTASTILWLDRSDANQDGANQDIGFAQHLAEDIYMPLVDCALPGIALVMPRSHRPMWHWSQHSVNRTELDRIHPRSKINLVEPE